MIEEIKLQKQIVVQGTVRLDKPKKRPFEFQNKGKKPHVKSGSESAFSSKCIEGTVEGSKMGEYPYCTIGKIIGHGKDILYGTGFLIGEDTVMTCAHNLYHHPKDGGESWEVNDLTFIIYSKDENKLKEYKIKEFYYPPGYREAREKQDPRHCQEDYAFLYLQQQLGQKNGYLGFEFDPIKEKISKQAKFMVAGFQGKNYFISSAISKPTTKFTVNENFISHQLSTIEGESGSPFMVERGDSNLFYVVGIHIQGINNVIQKGSNLSRRLNVQMLKVLHGISDDILNIENISGKGLNSEEVQAKLQQKYINKQNFLLELQGEQNKIDQIPPFLYEKANNLVQLNLKDNQIKQIHQRVPKMQKLKVLLLAGNMLQRLPQSMKDTTLKQLDLSRNNPKITDGQFWEIIQSLKGLQILRLNQLEIQQVEKLPQQLIELHIAENRMTSLAQLVEKLSPENQQKRHFTYLNASNNKISSIESRLCNLEGATIKLVGNDEILKDQQSLQYIKDAEEYYRQTIILKQQK